MRRGRELTSRAASPGFERAAARARRAPFLPRAGIYTHCHGAAPTASCPGSRLGPRRLAHERAPRPAPVRLGAGHFSDQGASVSGVETMALALARQPAKPRLAAEQHHRPGRGLQGPFSQCNWQAEVLDGERPRAKETICVFGDSGRIRTCDLPLRRRLPNHNDKYRRRNIITLIHNHFAPNCSAGLSCVDNME